MSKRTSIKDSDAAIIFAEDGEISILLPEKHIDEDGLPKDGEMPDYITFAVQVFFSSVGYEEYYRARHDA